MYKENDVIRLIDRLYKDLYLSDDVLRRESDNKYDKFGNIKRYLDRLERVHDSVRDTGRHKDMLKKMYYDRYVIKREDIPESYYIHQQEIALERGYGHVNITHDMKRQYQDEIINNQKTSLDIWLDYFLSEDAKDYPFWAKYWAFQGMLRLGNYDKENGEFGRRTKDTVSPFVDLNREALAISIDLIIKLLNKEEIEDKELDVLVKSGSFQKIYAYVITHVLKDNKSITKKNNGVWVKYNRGSDHMILVKSLQGYNTGWCTAGEATAKSQLANGDFYVYYTLDENDDYKVPRIAIRMDHGKIAEIRGVAVNQNIESDMECVVEEKLKEFPDRKEYYKKVNDMKVLTKIYKKHHNDEELTKEELRFLYEIDGNITGFGYQKDPRIEEIINERGSFKKDLATIFECGLNQVAIKQSELNNNMVYFHGDLNLSDYKETKDLVLPKYVRGNLDLRGLTSAEGLVLPQSVGETLDLSGLTSAKDLIFPQSIGGALYLGELTSAKGLKLPKSIGGDLYLGCLTSADGLELPQSIGKSLYLRSLTSAEGLNIPQSIGGNLALSGLTSAEDLELPQSIGKSLNLSGLASAKGLVLPESIGGDLNLSGLSSAEGLKLPQSIGGDLWLTGLTSAKGLRLPQSIGGSLILGRLTSANDLVLPQNFDGSLSFWCLTSVKGLILPQSVGGDLYLNGLTSAEKLKLPQSIGGKLYLRGLTNAEGLIIPEVLTYTIVMNGFDITPENVDEYRNKKRR